MTLLTDLLDTDDLHDELREGYVRLRWHPLAPLAIFNYAEKAQYEGRWNDITRQCRGLIVDTETNEVLARPFDKFFNYGEHPEGSLWLGAPAVATDKLDGSLGILYPGPQGWEIATRGSFTSDQALYGTALLFPYLAAGFTPEPGVTYLFEIIYPENRIVLDYGDRRDLVLIGTRLVRSGHYLPAAVTRRGWSWDIAQPLPAPSLGEALELPPRPNAEGIVVSLPEGINVKIKQDDYVRLHKLVTGLNERVVWEHLSTHDGTYGGLLAEVPDEFHAWVREVADGLIEQYETIHGRAHAAFWEVDDQFLLEWGPEEWQDSALERGYRRWWATKFKEHGDLTPLLFRMLDGRDISPLIWKTLKPRGDSRSLLNRSEDTA